MRIGTQLNERKQMPALGVPTPVGPLLHTFPVMRQEMSASKCPLERTRPAPYVPSHAAGNERKCPLWGPYVPFDVADLKNITQIYS